MGIGNGLETYYLHMVNGSRTVEKDDVVVRGQPLGVLGKTGTNKTHLHLGFYYNGSADSNVNILNYLTMEGLRLNEYIVRCAPYQDENGVWQTALFEYYPSSN
jgi:murein DD-endopeptidase MepM/ murein hydrolase activator NlpD